MLASNHFWVTIGHKVRERRLALGLSQDELATRASAPQAAISRIERDETKDPGFLLIARIAKALGLPVDHLLPPAEPPEVSAMVEAPPPPPSEVEQLKGMIQALDGKISAVAEQAASVADGSAQMVSLLRDLDGRVSEIEAERTQRRKRA